MTRRSARKKNKDSEPFLDSFFFRSSSKLLFGLVVAVIFLTLAQCTVKKPESPVWDTQLTVPLINRTYSMDDLIDRIDQDGIVMDSTGSITFSFSEDLDTVTLDSEEMSSSDISYSLSETLGVVTIDPPDGDVAVVPLAGIVGLATSLPGDQAAVPAGGFAVVNVLSIASTFSTATITNGTAEIYIENNLGVDLDTVIVSLVDVNLGILATDTLEGGLPALTTDTVLLDLAGNEMTSSLRLESLCHTPGGLVTSASTRYIESELAFPTQIQVVEAVTEVLPFTKEFASQVELGETDRIDTAILAGGNLNLQINNATNLDADLIIVIPDFELAGTPLTVTRTATADAVQNIAIDLTGYKIVPSDRTVPQILDITASADLPGSGTTKVLVTQNDSIAVTAGITNLEFGSVTGVFDGVGAAFDGIQQEIEVPTGFDDVELQVAVLTLTIENTVDLPGVIDVQLTGDHGNFITLNGAITAAGSSSSTTILTVTDSANFLAPIPSQITVSGSVTFGDGVYQGTLEASDFISAHIDVTAPIFMVIPQSEIDTDIQRESINQEDVDIITDHLNEAIFSYNVISQLPIGACVEFYLGPDSATLFTNYQLKLPKTAEDSIFIPVAPVDQYGVASDTISTGFVSISLDSLDTRVLENDTLFIGQKITLLGSSGQAVRLSQSDFITIMARIEVDYRFDGEF